jgi:hypothetical protein
MMPNGDRIMKVSCICRRCGADFYFTNGATVLQLYDTCPLTGASTGRGVPSGAIPMQPPKIVLKGSYPPGMGWLPPPGIAAVAAEPEPEPQPKDDEGDRLMEFFKNTNH